WGKDVRVTQCSADGLDGDLLVARRTRRQTTPRDVGRRGIGVVAQTLLKLIDVGEPEVKPVILVDDMIQAEGYVRDRLFDVINVIKVGADEWIVDAVGKGRSRIDRLRQGTDATDRDLIVHKREAL